MIINSERKPSLSLLYIGGCILKILKHKKSITIDNLLITIQNEYIGEITSNFLYYSLDWLFLTNAIKIKNERIFLC